MPSEMLERVAKAIQDQMDGWLAEDGTVDDLGLARAAVAAMRNPDDKLLYAADGWSDLVMGWGGDASERRAEFRMVWQAQIDAILALAP